MPAIKQSTLLGYLALAGSEHFFPWTYPPDIFPSEQFPLLKTIAGDVSAVGRLRNFVTMQTGNSFKKLKL